MKNFRSIMLALSLLFVFTTICIGYANAETAPDNYLKMKGKILDGKTADITVFQEYEGEWIEVESMSNKSNYSLKLDPKENYYITFDSKENLIKTMYVDAGTKCMWSMHLNIDFGIRDIKYARVYQHPSTKGYSIGMMLPAEGRTLIDNSVTASN